MVRSGVASATDELAVHEQVQQAADSVAVLRTQRADLELTMADRVRDWKQRELDRAAARNKAQVAVDEAKTLLAMTELRSPATGRVESLLVNPGSVVQAGEIMAQVVPKDAPRAIVAFLPSREMSFVEQGSVANVEVDSLPVNEFGMAHARVDRISSDIAKAEEISLAFGEPLAGSFVRVELTLLDDEAQEKMAPHLRSGERLTLRLHRRDERIIGLIFEFMRKWLEQQ
jgi:multidrug resistance efflux pump